jgi:hypothetical protein
MFKWKKFTGDGNQWDSLVNQFDGNYRQYFSWGEYKRELGWDIYRYIGTDHDTIKFVVQLLVRRFIFLTIVYIPGGVSGNDRGYCHSLKELISSLFRFSLIYVRLDSNYIASEEVESLFLKNGWLRPAYRLNPGISMRHIFKNNDVEIMPNASNKWKYNLRRSKKNDTKIIFDGDIQASEIFRISNEMQENKKISLRGKPEHALNIMRYFEDQFVFARCIDKHGNMIGFRCALTIDDKAWDLYGAMDINGKKFRSGYLLLFELMNECKNRGIKSFNLGGVEYKTSPGVAKFKVDTGGELYKFVSEWEYTNFIFFRYIIGFYLYMKFDTIVAKYFGKNKD